MMSDDQDATGQFSPFGQDDGEDNGRDGGADRGKDGGGADDRTTQIPRTPEDPTVVTPRPVRADATSIIPPVDDDWAASRGNPAWSGRAEVRGPRPGQTDYTDPGWTAGSREPRDRWWLPIVIGIVVLVVLAALGGVIYLVVQNSADDTPTPATTTSAAVVRTTEPTTTAPTTEATTEPPTSAPTTSAPPTTEPTTTESTVPALNGLSLAEAQAALNRTGLNYRLLYRKSDAPAGTVIDSDPHEGQEVPPDTTITLVIATQHTAAPTATASATGEDND